MLNWHFAIYNKLEVRMVTGGGGQSLARILAAIEGFVVRHGQWPTAVRVTPGYLKHIQDNVLTEDEFSRFSPKIALIPDAAATVVAQNEAGLTYDYGKSGFSKGRPSVRARDWLGLNTSNTSLDADASPRRSI
jgi:hypothetical protein